MLRFVVVVLAATLVTNSAHALVLCAPKKGEGTLSVRTACKKKQTVIDPASVGLEGLQGPTGQTGPTGPTGADGAVGISGYEVVSSAQQMVFVQNSGGMPGLSAVVTQPCPEGKRAIGGGYDLTATDKGVQRDIRPVMSRPTADGTGWSIQLFNAGVSFDFNAELVVTVVCVNVAS